MGEPHRQGTGPSLLCQLGPRELVLSVCIQQSQSQGPHWATHTVWNETSWDKTGLKMCLQICSHHRAPSRDSQPLHGRHARTQQDPRAARPPCQDTAGAQGVGAQAFICPSPCVDSHRPCRSLGPNFTEQCVHAGTA